MIWNWNRLFAILVWTSVPIILLGIQLAFMNRWGIPTMWLLIYLGLDLTALAMGTRLPKTWRPTGKAFVGHNIVMALVLLFFALLNALFPIGVAVPA